MKFFAAAFSLLALLPTAQAQNNYVLDDGASNIGLTYQLPEDFGWLQSFVTVGPTDSITKLRLMFQPGAIPPGTPLHLCVWEDPSDDMDPYDVSVVANIQVSMPVVSGLNYIDFPLPNPATVHGVFFIGAYLTTDGNAPSLALIDTNAPVVGRAWFATSFPGGFDPNNMGWNNPNHIETLGQMFHGAFMLRAEGSGNAPTVYCSAKQNSVGCTPNLSWLGAPSASAGSGFLIQASNVINRTSGMLIYSVQGRANTPFGGGTLCIAQPLRRTPVQNSGGSPTGVNCTGVYSFDFAAWIASGVDTSLVPGTLVDAQYYSRDPGFAAPNNIGLTAGFEFLLTP